MWSMLDLLSTVLAVTSPAVLAPTRSLDSPTNHQQTMVVFAGGLIGAVTRGTADAGKSTTAVGLACALGLVLLVGRRPSDQKTRLAWAGTAATQAGQHRERPLR